MFYQPTCEEICFALKEVDRQQLIFHLVHGTYKRIWLSLEDRLVQAKEMYLIPWMFLETEIVFLVKSTPTNISMDHRSFGHHWTAEVYTYKYQHGPQIIWSPLNSQNLHLQISAWTTDHLGTTEQPKSTPANIRMDHRSFGHHWTASLHLQISEWTTDHLVTTEQPKSTPTNISMDHRSFGHHWTAKIYTYIYQHGPQIIWAPLNSRSLHLQISAWITDHLGTTEQPKSIPTNEI
jgi:hypothetical protein